MVIDTRTKESMIESLAEYLGTTEEKLIRNIKHAADKAKADGIIFYEEIFDSELLDIMTKNHSKKVIDTIYVYHLTRRLNDSSCDK